MRPQWVRAVTRLRTSADDVRLAVIDRYGDFVTEISEPDVIEEALAVIDQGLGQMQHRELVSTDEVSNLLLDLRLLLITNASEPVPAPT